MPGVRRAPKVKTGKPESQSGKSEKDRIKNGPGNRQNRKVEEYATHASATRARTTDTRKPESQSGKSEKISD